ncbi:hypothetical protein EDB89DRAFT_1903745 [Lactarius sanguifluus]|nr:hypothetical protein EDB89DRAFT_1903745 [Lactarius sanguifluus]
MTIISPPVVVSPLLSTLNIAGGEGVHMSTHAPLICRSLRDPPPEPVRLLTAILPAVQLFTRSSVLDPGDSTTTEYGTTREPLGYFILTLCDDTVITTIFKLVLPTYEEGTCLRHSQKESLATVGVVVVVVNDKREERTVFGDDDDDDCLGFYGSRVPRLFQRKTAKHAGKISSRSTSRTTE